MNLQTNMFLKNGIIACCIIVFMCFGVSFDKTPSIGQKFKNYFPIGTAINPDVDLANKERMNFIAFQYTSITPENQMKPKQIHPGLNTWNWEPADRIVEFAIKNKMKVRGHTLVWQQNIPNWLVKDNGLLCDKATLYKRMQDHIIAVVGRYKNAVKDWDVVNEAVSDNPKELFRARDTLNIIAGEEYIEKAFQFAHEADPSARLFYNDYRFSDSIKRRKIYNLLKRLKSKGVPIHGVGLQSHYVPEEVSSSYLQETIDMFYGLGLEIQITELDVSIYNYRAKDFSSKEGIDSVNQNEYFERQRKFYSMLFNLYRKNKDKITSVTFWGSSDMRNNFRTRRIGRMDYPFLFDEDMKPKQVFFDVLNF